MIGEADRGPSSGDRWEHRPGDWLLLLAVPVVLTAVFVLPEPVKLEYVLAYEQPTIETAFAAHFVHLTVRHLGSNLVAYVLLVALAYLFSQLADRRREFFVTFTTFLLVFPVVLSGLNILFPRPRIGYGFSGIVAAFLGFLPLTLLWFLEERFDGIDSDHAPLLFFLGTGVIAVWGVPATFGSWIGTAIATVAGVLYLHAIAADLTTPKVVASTSPFDDSVAFAGFGVSLFVLLVFAAFPTDPVEGRKIANLLLHLFGYCFGFMVPYATFRLVERHGTVVDELRSRLNNP